MLNLLLVDDRQDSHLLIKAFLDSQNVHVDSAYTAAEALKKVYENDYGLVFLDLHLPDGDGYSVLAKIRQDKKDLPVYILSANAYEEDIEKSRKMGAIDHLSKPIRKQTIVDVVSKYRKK
jgi:CheY-like chemotaxis protein